MSDSDKLSHRHFERGSQLPGAANPASEAPGSYFDAPDLWGFENKPQPVRKSIELYHLDDVRAAMGLSSGPSTEYGDVLFESHQDSEHQARLSAILGRGEEARWRYAYGPASNAESAIASLIERAPHFDDLGKILRVNAKAALNIGLPMFVHPVLLVGEPGIGKSWLLSKIAKCVGLPARAYAMSGSSLSEGIQGAHPSWRNADCGLVAKTLLAQPVANPVLFVDEFDKVSRGNWNVDPYRPFYQLFEPSGAKSFVDEYLGFQMNASAILWVMAVNSIDEIPAPILDRLTILHVPQPSPEMRIAIVESIYGEANTKYLSFFEPRLERPVINELLKLNSRGVRIAIEAAMATAAADGRGQVVVGDVKERYASQRAIPVLRQPNKRRLN